MSLISIALLYFITKTVSLDIECEYKFVEVELKNLNLKTIQSIKVTNRYTCFAKQYSGNSNKNIEKVTGQHQENQSNNDVRAISFSSMEVPKIPLGLSNIFPNLLTVILDNCNLTFIGKKDIGQFEKMTFFSASKNQLTKLDGHLFENNPKLRIIDFSQNKIIAIGDGFVNFLPKLEIAFFSDNPCINRSFVITEDSRRMKNSLKMMGNELKVLCPPILESESKSDKRKKDYYEEYESEEYEEYYEYYEHEKPKEEEKPEEEPKENENSEKEPKNEEKIEKPEENPEYEAENEESEEESKNEEEIKEIDQPKEKEIEKSEEELEEYAEDED